MAAGLTIAQLRAQMALPDHYAAEASTILDHVRAELPAEHERVLAMFVRD